MTRFITKLKISAKNFFNRLGFQVSRLPYQPRPTNEPIRVKVGNFHIWINGNHQLPMYMRNPYYSTNLPRLAAKLQEKYANLTMLDVGANVGDTVAFVRSKSYFPIVCLEGDEDFFQLLQKNLANFQDVYAFRRVLGEKSGKAAGVLKKNEGSFETARIQNQGAAGSTGSLNLVTLDSFLGEEPKFKNAKLLKTDTDGYDLKIIRGGLGYIEAAKPVLFFEYDTVFLAEQHEDGLATLKILESLGYRDAMFYDNSGRFLLSADLSDHRQIAQLHNLIDRNYRTPFPFYDIVLFHQEDKDVAQAFIEDEVRFFSQP